MKIKLNNKVYPLAPEYQGVAKIVDVTTPRVQETKYGVKETFRFILEINAKDEKGNYHTVSTPGYTMSLHEKAGLRKFVDKVRPSPLTEQEAFAGIDTETLVGTYCNVVVEHNKSETTGKVYANITYVGKAKDDTKWESGYVRFQDRDGMPQKTIQSSPTPQIRKSLNKTVKAEAKAAEAEKSEAEVWDLVFEGEK